MATGDELIERWAKVRRQRDRVRRERDARVCERETMVESEDNPTLLDPCWKAARKWTGPTPYSEGGQFYLDPPIASWCLPCQERQALTDQLRVLSRQHAGALRGLISRGKVLLRQSGE